jgi:uncharacterized membrane protein
MQLSEAGEARVRGYLFLLDRSLRTFLKREAAADAVREVESHIRERVLEATPMPNERDALNRLLESLGPPHRLARAWSAELAVDEAVTTGRALPTIKAVLALALHTAEGFAAGLFLLIGYMLSIAALIVCIAKPIFPNNVGVVTINGRFHGAGFELWLPPDAVISHGWELAIGSGIFGLILLIVTHRRARAYVRRVKARRGLARAVLA